jgi:hypothetical protein
MYLLNDPENFYFIFAYHVEFYADFKCVEITAKSAPRKSYFPKTFAS